MINVKTFDANVIDAVTAHMNGDHADDNLLIARAFGRPEATASEMIAKPGTSAENEFDTPGGTPSGILMLIPRLMNCE